MANSIFSTPNPSRTILCDMDSELEATLFSDLDMDLDLDLLPATPELMRMPPATTPRLHRGPMYSAYAELRERRLRRKLEGGATTAEEYNSGDDCLPTFHATPQPKKTPLAAAAASPMVCRSVPNFRAVMRKENRKPAAVGAASPMLPASKLARVWEAPPPPVFRTPPPSLAPSRSAARRKLAVGRIPVAGVGAAAATKSVSCLKELKGFAAATELDSNRKGVGGGGGTSARGGAIVRKSLSSMRRYM